MLLLSGIQHYAFCPRQWALIHLEQIWMDNVRTVEGKQLHERADDPFSDESRKGVRVVHALPISCHRLGFRGVADVVEFHMVSDRIQGLTCKLDGREGWWIPIPIEYKRGNPKPDDCDAVQLCAQAIALEEMMHITVSRGYLFYGQTRRREEVYFVETLRLRVEVMCQEMHQLMDSGITPKAQKGHRCRLCSLVNYCQPKWTIKHRNVKAYIDKVLQGE
jgi:CRISPR-associated exonuclease Cas4